jgi:hypothetical protein
VCWGASYSFGGANNCFRITVSWSLDALDLSSLLRQSSIHKPVVWQFGSTCRECQPQHDRRQSSRVERGIQRDRSCDDRLCSRKVVLMHITFSPQRRDEALTLEKSSGDRLRINGELFNFNPLPDGGSINALDIPCGWVTGMVERIDGEVHLKIILPHGSNPSHGVAFPEPITVTDDGPIEVPHDRTEVEELATEGGTIIRTTFYPWGAEPQVRDEFVPEQQPEPVDTKDEELADVDA